MTTENEVKAPELEVIEEAPDGSAVIELPEGEESPVQNDEDADAHDDTDEVREAKRARRRAKKDYVRQRNAEKDARLEALQRQNQELTQRLSAIEQRAYNSDLARLDKAIEDENLRLQYAMTKMREATDQSDGDAFVRAREMENEARRRLDSLQTMKHRASDSQPEQTSISQKAKKMASEWLSDNSWYDPEGNDEDSQIAKVIDTRLTQEGWDPGSAEYWEELDNRLQKRLPHLYNRNNRENTQRRPRSVVTGSVRESVDRGSGNGYVLSPERVRAIKEAGMWDNTEKRNRMIKQFIAYDKANRG